MTRLYFAKLRPDFFENDFNRVHLSADAFDVLRSMRNFVIVSHSDFFDNSADYDAEHDEFINHRYCYIPDFVSDADSPDSHIFVRFAILLNSLAHCAIPFLCDPSDIVAQHSIDLPEDVAHIVSMNADEYLDFDPLIEIKHTKYMTDFMRDLLPVLNTAAQ